MEAWVQFLASTVGSSIAAAVVLSQLWLGFSPWSGTFHMLLLCPLKKKKKKERKKRKRK